jgi:hypothetical protein
MGEKEQVVAAAAFVGARRVWAEEEEVGLRLQVVQLERSCSPARQ